MDRRPRSRPAYAVALALVIAAGLGSRVFGRWLPAPIAAYAGDTLYATMVFVGLAIVAPRWSTTRLALTALACCCAVEVSQLYHAPWIDAIRTTVPGALVLGYGFLWSDLACYAVGVALGAAADRLAVLTETDPVMNARWHDAHPMPPRATLDQRVAWHVAHAKACGCRADAGDRRRRVAAARCKAGSGRQTDRQEALSAGFADTGPRCDKLFAWVPSRRSSSPACPAPST